MAYWLLVASVLTFLAGLILLPVVIVRMRPDYFLRDLPDRWQGYHPVIRATLFAVKNLLGLILLAAGVVMLFTPGQGVLSILAGLSLMNFPGKRSLEIWIVSRPLVLRGINAIRTRAGREPLRLPRPRRGGDRKPMEGGRGDAETRGRGEEGGKEQDDAGA